MLFEKYQFILLRKQHANGDGTGFEALSTSIAPNEIPNLSTIQANREPLILNNIGESDVVGWNENKAPLKSYLGIPIIAGQQVIGFINLYSRLDNAFTSIHADYFRIFALQAGV